MPKERVINGAMSFGYYLEKIREHKYNEVETLLEIVGNYLKSADKKEAIESLDMAKITIQNKFSCFLDEIETEIKIEW